MNRNYITLFAALFLLAAVNAQAVQVSTIDVYPSSTTAAFVILLNTTGNTSINYGESIALMGNFSNDSVQKITHSYSLTGLTTNTSYYYSIQTCDAANNCTNTTIYSFNTVLIQSVLPASSKGMEFGILVTLLAIAFTLTAVGWAYRNILLLLLAGTLMLINGFFFFTGITQSFQLSTGIVQVYYSNFFLQSVGVTLVAFSIYLYLKATQFLMEFIQGTKQPKYGSYDMED